LVGLASVTVPSRNRRGGCNETADILNNLDMALLSMAMIVLLSTMPDRQNVLFDFLEARLIDIDVLG
jgi:hypothetical protein